MIAWKQESVQEDGYLSRQLSLDLDDERDDVGVGLITQRIEKILCARGQKQGEARKSFEPLKYATLRHLGTWCVIVALYMAWKLSNASFFDRIVRRIRKRRIFYGGKKGWDRFGDLGGFHSDRMAIAKAKVAQIYPTGSGIGIRAFGHAIHVLYYCNKAEQNGLNGFAVVTLGDDTGKWRRLHQYFLLKSMKSPPSRIRLRSDFTKKDL